jgi:hypothetical protein
MQCRSRRDLKQADAFGSARGRRAQARLFSWLLVARPPPGARAYANESSEDSRQVTLICEAACQGDVRER